MHRHRDRAAHARPGIPVAGHFRFVRVTWTALAFPTVVLGSLFLAFQFLGDGLRDALDPRTVA